jgi:hypothetical protein
MPKTTFGRASIQWDLHGNTGIDFLRSVFGSGRSSRSVEGTKIANKPPASPLLCFRKINWSSLSPRETP